MSSNANRRQFLEGAAAAAFTSGAVNLVDVQIALNAALNLGCTAH